MKRAIRQYRGPVVVIVIFAALATVAGLYTVGKQRAQLPFKDRYTVRVTFTRTPGLAPGGGQPALVSGVRVGQVTDVELVEGRSVVTLSIERSRLPRVYRDAAATLRPNSPLEDLQIDLDPGARRAGALPDGGLIAAQNTAVPVSASQLLRGLDADTRRYMSVLISSLGLGLDGRGGDLRRLFEQTGPTAKQTADLSRAVARRRETLADVVDALSALAVSAGEQDDDIRAVVAQSAATLEAMASQDAALRSSLRQLPGTLAVARRGLDAVGSLSDDLEPTVERLTPVARRLPAALRSTDRLSRAALPSLRGTVRPLVATAVPALTPLPPALDHLEAVTPDLSTTFKLVEYAQNELFYDGGEKTKSYAYWAAWAQHNANSVVSNGDAVSQALRGGLLITCGSILSAGQIGAPALGVPTLSSLLNGITSLVPEACPKSEGDR